MYLLLGTHLLLFCIFFPIQGSILEIKNITRIFNCTLFDNETIETFAFGYAQYNPLLNETCMETCKEAGKFVSCAFPTGEFQVAGFLLSYNAKNEKNIHKILNGYSLIPSVSDDFCFCQRQGLALAYENEYQALKMGFDYLALFVTQTMDAIYESILAKEEKGLALHPMYGLLKVFYSATLCPLSAWCQEKDVLYFGDPEGPEGRFSVHFLNELVEKIENFENDLTDFSLFTFFPNTNTDQSVKNIIQKMDFFRPLSILYGLQYRAHTHGLGLSYHVCREEIKL